jgi:hypothetical protein
VRVPVAHAVHNATWTLLSAFTVTTHPVVVEEYLAGDNGALILITTVLAAMWIRRRLVRRTLGVQTHSHLVAASA